MVSDAGMGRVEYRKGTRMKTFTAFNRWTDARPGRTLLAIFVVFALACAMLPSDPPSVAVVGMSR